VNFAESILAIIPLWTNRYIDQSKSGSSEISSAHLKSPESEGLLMVRKGAGCLSESDSAFRAYM
jgi:hypothetical protein